MSTTEIEDVPPLPDLDATDAIISDADASVILASLPGENAMRITAEEFQRRRDIAMVGWYPWWKPFMRRTMPRVSQILELQRTCIHEHSQPDRRRCADCGLSHEDICGLEDKGVFVAR